MPEKLKGTETAMNAPDRYCLTAPDGDCISTDPRCMHQPQHVQDAAMLNDADNEHARDFLARWTLRDRNRTHPQHRHFLTPSPTPLTSISDLLLSWSRGEWLIIDGHSYHPDFYINWRLRKLVGAVMRGKVYRAMGEDGEVYRVEGWESEHKEQEQEGV